MFSSRTGSLLLVTIAVVTLLVWSFVVGWGGRGEPIQLDTAPTSSSSSIAELEDGPVGAERMEVANEPTSADPEADALDASRRLELRVVDEAGEPVAGVGVRFSIIRLHEEFVRQAQADDEGRGVVDSLPGWFAGGRTRLTSDTYSLVRSSEIELDSAGGWKPVTVVVAPMAEVRVSVLDAFDEPVVGLAIQAAPTDSERYDSVPFDAFWDQSIRPGATTDAEGVAVLRTFAGVPLRLTLAEGEWERSTEEQQGNALSFDRIGQRVIATAESH